MAKHWTKIVIADRATWPPQQGRFVAKTRDNIEYRVEVLSSGMIHTHDKPGICHGDMWCVWTPCGSVSPDANTIDGEDIMWWKDAPPPLPISFETYINILPDQTITHSSKSKERCIAYTHSWNIYKVKIDFLEHVVKE